jgi:hypothetical protein
MPKIVLRDEKAPHDIRRLTVYDHEGGIRLDGWDLGDGVEAIKGCREYEWIVTVAASALPALVAALGGAEGEDIFEVISRTCMDDPNRLYATLVDAKIPYDFWSRVGD